MSERQPVYFIGHGNPMNALGDTPLSVFLRSWGQSLTGVRAIVVVSAHWRGSVAKITSSPAPETLHDFFGFPERLFALRYAVPGHPDVARRVADLLRAKLFEAVLDEGRGLDHGVWAPLIVARPQADLPVVQVSLLRATPERHLELGRALAPLRDEGVLLVGSGNLVHNLGTAVFDEPEAPVAEWAAAFDAWAAEQLEARNDDALTAVTQTPAGHQAHPTDEHFVPVLVCAGAAGREARVSFPYQAFEHGTISMRCVRFD